MTRNATILGALALAAVVVLFLVRLGGRAPVTGPRTARIPAEARPASPEIAGAPEAPGRGPVAEGSAATASVAATRGVLRLEFVNALDGLPVPDLPFHVYRERNGDQELAHGRSDARGRAEVRDLEAATILVETARRPPFASRVAGCQLGRGETKELLVSLDGGARVVGRAVDESHQPLASAEVLVAADFAAEPARNPLDREGAAAVTGPDGQFAVDCVADRPKGVWIVGNEMRPERWEAAEIFVRKDCAVARKVPDVKPGTMFDLGDVTLPRCSDLVGTVLDAGAKPVPGALVAWRGERRSVRSYGAGPLGDPDAFRVPPGSEGFRLHTGETLTDPAGRFELGASSEKPDLAVWAPSGQRQVFHLTDVAPAGKPGELVLKLDAITMLEIELRDRDGARVTDRAEASGDEGLKFFYRQDASYSSGCLVALVRLADGSPEEMRTAADPDGIFRCQIETDPAQVRELTLKIPGYATIADHLEGRVQPVTRVSYVVQEIPTLRFRLVPAGSSAPAEQRLGLQTCLASPDRRRDLVTTNCCGLGAHVWLDWKQQPIDIAIPAIAPRPYWLYLKEAPWIDAASFGPFEAGDEVHEIEVDADRLRAKSAGDERTAPERIEPGERVKPAHVTLRAIDARTDEPIPVLKLYGHLVEHAETSRWLRASAKGLVDRQPIAPGTWRFTVSGRGYRERAIPDVTIVEDEMKDLGTIPLERSPELRARVVEADGSPVPRFTWVHALGAADPDDNQTRTTQTDEDGRFVLLCDFPERAFLELSEPSVDDSEDPGGAQRLFVDGWRADEERELRLAPWQRVEVRIGGAAIDPPGTALALSAHPAADAGAPQGKPLGGRELDATPTRRIFRFRLPAGKYQVSGRSLLAEVPAQEIDVRESSDLQVFELTSR